MDRRFAAIIRSLTGSEQPIGMKIAVIGSGIAGLGAAWALSRSHDVALFERRPRLGGHARTIDIVVGDRLVPVDTGFIVYNERNYPNLAALFAHHGIETAPTDMSLSVSDGDFEFAPQLGALLTAPGRTLTGRNLGILTGANRFRRSLREISHLGDDVAIGDHLRAEKYPKPFIDHFLMPLAAAVWSGSAADATAMPAATVARFLANHGLFDFPRPQWRTVVGGSREYVERLGKEIPRVHADVAVRGVDRIGDGVVVRTDDGVERYDHVVLATHAPTSLDLLTDATPLERSILGGFRYAPNRVVVHGDTSFMPRRRRAWASWNATTATDPSAPVAVTYWMNRLQGLDERIPIFVTLNPGRQPREVFDEAWFGHPQFTTVSDRAQRCLPTIQGVGGVWHCGAWTGNGFHEDGLQSGLTVAAALGSPAPWHEQVVPTSPSADNARPRRDHP